MQEFREVIYRDVTKIKDQRCLLAGDIGGTNSNFGIFIVQDTKYILLVSLHAKSQEVTDFSALVAQITNYLREKYAVTITQACIGVAGLVSVARDVVQPTNLAHGIDAAAIKTAANLEKVILINDFEAVAWGLDHIAPHDIITINQGVEKKYAQKACIGAGTGLGKVGLVWNAAAELYMPVASEGGHADCVAYTPQECQLLQFIQSNRGGDTPVSWEEVLSGNGIKLLYMFLGQLKQYPVTPVSHEIETTGFQVDLISRYALHDARCKETFDWYVTLYARCAKNFALELLAINGIYIAGGIAAKNLPLFQGDRFKREFFNNERYSRVLTQMPCFVVADYNVNLYGSICFLQVQSRGLAAGKQAFC